MRARTSPPPRPEPATRHRGLTVGAVALVTATLTALVADAVTGVLTNALRGGWERVAGGEALVLNVAQRPGDLCGGRWLLPAGAGPVPAQPGGPERFVEWVRARGGTQLPAPVVELTVRGRSGEVVVLRELRVTVVERRPVPAGRVVGVPCGGDQRVRTYLVELDERSPVPRPQADPVLGDVPPVPFPYRVTSSDAEVIRVLAGTGGCDCRWVLDLVYVDGEQERTLRIDDGGQPFRTVGALPAGASPAPTPSPGAGP